MKDIRQRRISVSPFGGGLPAVLPLAVRGRTCKIGVIKIGVVISTLFLLANCTTQTETSNSNSSPFEAGGQYDKELSQELEEFKKEEEVIRKANEDKLTDIEFETKSFDFGTVKVQSENAHYFVFKNTGKKPLVIESVQASCGCTTPMKPEKPIMPNQKDSIKVQFVPYQGMSGAVEKTVTIKANTFIPVNQVFIRANVE